MEVKDCGKYFEVGCEQRTPIWHLLRKGKITGSVFGQAVGVSPYGGPRSLQKSILEEKPFHGSAYTRHGNKWEDHAGEVFKQCTGAQYRMMGFAISKRASFVGVSPDGVLFDPELGDYGLLEIKCPATLWYNGVPPQYMAQVQGVMAVLGLKTCKFVVYKPANFGGESFAEADFRPLSEEEANYPERIQVWDVPANRDYQLALFKGLRWFWSKVVLAEEIPTKRSGLQGYANPFVDELNDVEVNIKVAYEHERLKL